jgi:heat shock protein HslJ
MKRVTKHTELQTIVGVLLLCLSALSGCQKNSLEGMDTIRLKEIREDSVYTSLPLIGTKWKLVGFVDQKQKTIKLAMPDDWEDNFTIILNENGTVKGRTSANSAMGSYSLAISQNNKITMHAFGIMTYVGEANDGELFIESMKKIYSYEINKKGLELVYEKNKYLLFQPYRPGK